MASDTTISKMTLTATLGMTNVPAAGILDIIADLSGDVSSDVEE